MVFLEQGYYSMITQSHPLQETQKSIPYTGHVNVIG